MIRSFLRSAAVSFGVISVQLFSPQSALATQVAAILGAPDRSISSIDDIIVESVDISHLPYETNITTQLFSIFVNHGIRAAAAVEALDADGSVPKAVLAKSIHEALIRARVVFTDIGGSYDDNDEICGMMKAHLHTAFVLAAGKLSHSRNRGTERNCTAAQILRVSALDADGKRLRPDSNYGPTIRLAAPGTLISTIGAGGRVSSLSGSSAAAAIVAADLALYAQEHLTLLGSALIDRFLVEKTIRLDSLEGKISEARAHF